MKKDKVTSKYKYASDNMDVDKKSLVDAVQHADSKIFLVEQGNYESGKSYLIVKIVC